MRCGSLEQMAKPAFRLPFQLKNHKNPRPLALLGVGIYFDSQNVY